MALLSAVTAITLPLDLPTAEPARRTRTELEHILTAAVLPRLRTPDAPLLCALAGPTGVGKSTLLNALAGNEVSATGPLRPTTRTPVLVCNPADLGEGGEAVAGVAAAGQPGESAVDAAARAAAGEAATAEPAGAGEAAAARDASVGTAAAAGQAGEPGAATAGQARDGAVATARRAGETAARQAHESAAATPDGASPGADGIVAAGTARIAANSMPEAGAVERPEATPEAGAAREPESATEAGAAEEPELVAEAGPGAEPELAAEAGPGGEPQLVAEAADATWSADAASSPHAASSADASSSAHASSLAHAASPAHASSLAHAASPAHASSLADVTSPAHAASLAHATTPADAASLAEGLPRSAQESAAAGGVALVRAGVMGGGLADRIGADLASLLSSSLPSPSLPRGVAIVDTVDGDVAVVGAADVVVVVVSAERYADAAVWRVLRRAGASGVPVVVVLGRVSAGVVEEVSGAFGDLLRVNGFGAAPFFVVEEVGGQGEARARGVVLGGGAALGMDGGQGENGADVAGYAPGEGGYGNGGHGRADGPAGETGTEVGDSEAWDSEAGDAELGDTEVGDTELGDTELGDEGGAVGAGVGVGAGRGGMAGGTVISTRVPLVPDMAVAGLRGWLRDAGADTAGRVRIGMLGVAGRLDSVDRLVGDLAAAWEGQRLALQVLHQGLERVHTAERVRFRGAVDRGELLGGEVRIRWQELLGSGRVSALFGADDGGGGRKKRKRGQGDWSARFHNPTAHDAATAPLRAALVEAVARGHRAALERAARKTVDQWELTEGAPEPVAIDEATRRETDPTRAAAQWLDQLPATILEQGHSRRTTRTIGPAGAHIRSAALVLGVAALAGNAGGSEARSGARSAVTDEDADRTHHDDAAANAAIGLLHTLFGRENAEGLLASAVEALKDTNARLLDRASEPHRAQLAAYTLDPRQAEALAEAREAVATARARNEED